MKLLSRHWPSLRDHESLHRACRWLRSPPLPHWWSLNTGGIDHPSPPENCYLSGFLGWNFHLHWLHFLPNCVHCWLMSETSKTSTDVCFFISDFNFKWWQGHRPRWCWGLGALWHEQLCICDWISNIIIRAKLGQVALVCLFRDR